jgi:hypothetical protein
MPFLSHAQLVGYLAFVLGVSAFLQRVDRRLKLLIAAESLAYAVHFALLGNPSAASAAAVTAVRSLLATRFRSPWLAVAVVAVNVALGAALARGGRGWIPVLASSLGTVALFTLRGVAMRLVLLACTGLWLANNILSGSIGGTLLEAVIAAASLFTIARLVAAGRGRRLAAAETPEEDDEGDATALARAGGAGRRG